MSSGHNHAIVESASYRRFRELAMFGTAQNFVEPLSIINPAGRVDRRCQWQEIFE
jgi:hypothetical protein